MRWYGFSGENGGLTKEERKRDIAESKDARALTPSAVCRTRASPVKWAKAWLGMLAATTAVAAKGPAPYAWICY